jgi:hypothetical protein
MSKWLDKMLEQRPPPKQCKWIVKQKWRGGEQIHSYYMYQHTAEKFANLANQATTNVFWVEEIGA